MFGGVRSTGIDYIRVGAGASVQWFLDRRRLTEQGEQRQRIDARAADAHGPVQVRARHASGCTDLTDKRAARHVLSFRHAHLGEMREERVETESMVDDDAVARVIKVS